MFKEMEDMRIASSCPLTISCAKNAQTIPQVVQKVENLVDGSRLDSKNPAAEFRRLWCLSFNFPIANPDLGWREES